MNKDLFAIRLHEARIHCGYSLDKLVKAANLRITRQCLYRYEKGEMQEVRSGTGCSEAEPTPRVLLGRQC